MEFQRFTPINECAADVYVQTHKINYCIKLHYDPIRVPHANRFGIDEADVGYRQWVYLHAMYTGCPTVISLFQRHTVVRCIDPLVYITYISHNGQ